MEQTSISDRSGSGIKFWKQAKGPVLSVQIDRSGSPRATAQKTDDGELPETNTQLNVIYAAVTSPALSLLLALSRGRGSLSISETVSLLVLFFTHAVARSGSHHIHTCRCRRRPLLDQKKNKDGPA